MTKPRSTVDRRSLGESGACCWIWPLRLDRATAAQVWRWAGIGGELWAPQYWWLAAVTAGVLPVGLAYSGFFKWQQAFTGVLLFVPFVAAVRNDQLGRALALVGFVFGIHSLLAIMLVMHDPAAAGQFMPGAQAYWEKQEVWLRTGYDPEYEMVNWLPAHLQLLVGVAVLSFTSVGLVPLIEGVKEVDLMNFYVGRLAAGSHHPVTAVMLGWHVWSVLRGVAFAILIFEIASLSLERLSARSLSTRHRRICRWSFGLGVLACDCIVKSYSLKIVRDLLFQHLQT